MRRRLLLVGRVLAANTAANVAVVLWAARHDEDEWGIDLKEVLLAIFAPAPLTYVGAMLYQRSVTART